jgi:hypothetical protein
MPDSKTDPHRLPSPSVAESKQAAKREFIPLPAVVGIVLVIVAIVLLAVLG